MAVAILQTSAAADADVLPREGGGIQQGPGKINTYKNHPGVLVVLAQKPRDLGLALFMPAAFHIYIL
jgi:hypothetical protein